MPVHRDQEKKESTAADMEVEEHEHEASSTEEEDSDTTSVSEDGESSGERLKTEHSIFSHVPGCSSQVYFWFVWLYWSW